MNRMDTKRSILITGATGLIGRLLIKEIVDCSIGKNDIFLKKRMPKIRLILLVRNETQAKVQLANILNKTGIDIVFLETSVEVLKAHKVLDSIDYIFHCASTTKSVEMISQPIEVADGIVLGTKNVLELARQQKIKSMVYLSSMEVYGKVADTGALLLEDQLGDISLNSARSCYPLAKRMAEHYCYLYWREFGVPVKIARLAQTFGTGVSPKDERVFVQFARAVVENKDIVLRTAGTSMGNYCASEDALRAIFTILLKGVNGEVYNVTNEANTMRIREMAELVVTKIAKGHIKVQYDLDYCNTYGYPPDTGLRLSAMKLRKLGWQPTKELEEMYGDLIRELQ